MEGTSPGPNKGYQKQIKKDAPPPKQKIHPTTDYSSPAAKKWPKFIEAIESGNVDSVKQFIDEGMNVNLLRDGVTPLMLAASSGKKEVAEALLQAGVNINERGEDGGTALHKAASDQAEAGVVDLLVQSGVDTAAKNKAGKTALQLAEEKGRHDIVRVIKKHQAQLRLDAQEWEAFLNSAEGMPFMRQRQYDSLTRYSSFWWLPIVVLAVFGVLPGLLFGMAVLTGVIGAVVGSSIGGAVLLREKQLRKHLDEIGPLPELDIHVLRMKRQAGEPIFIEKREETKPPEETAEALTVDDGAGGSPADTVLIEEVLPAERPKREKKLSPAIIVVAAAVLVPLLLGGALFYKRDAVARWYFAKKLERSGISFTGQAFLDETAKNNEAALDLFIKAGMKAEAQNEKGQTALIIASEKGYVNLIHKLAKRSPSLLNHADKNGNTALMIAARMARQPVVQALVENGAGVNYVVPSNPGAGTALQAVLDAAEFKEEHLHMVKYLLQRGADVKGRNAAGQSPLMFTADRGRIEAAGLLLESGADVDAADLKGGFPLLFAACKGNSGLVALLAEKGANMKAALPDGQTPLMCAVQMGFADTVAKLLEKGADVDARTASGVTSLFDATRMGQVDIVKLLLARGADPGTASVPDSFSSFKGRLVAVNAKKSKLRDVLGKIAKTASQDGYACHADAANDRVVTMKVKASWNKALRELAAKSRCVLVVKDKEVYVVPYPK